PQGALSLGSWAGALSGRRELVSSPLPGVRGSEGSQAAGPWAGRSAQGLLAGLGGLEAATVSDRGRGAAPAALRWTPASTPGPGGSVGSSAGAFGAAAGV